MNRRVFVMHVVDIFVSFFLGCTLFAKILYLSNYENKVNVENSPVRHLFCSEHETSKIISKVHTDYEYTHK